MPDFSAIFWLVLLILFIVMESVTTSLVSIWFAAGSLAALILAGLKVQFWVQITVFVAVSIVLLLATRPFAKKFLEPKITKTNFDRIIGEICLVEEEINNLNETGSVKIKGTTWTARSSEDKILPVGTTVEIIRIEGVKVFVSEKK